MDKKYIEREKTFNKKEYDKNYNRNMYKVLSVRVRPTEFENINNYCTDNGINKTEFILAAIHEYIDNH